MKKIAINTPGTYRCKRCVNTTYNLSKVCTPCLDEEARIKKEEEERAKRKAKRDKKKKTATKKKPS